MGRKCERDDWLDDYRILTERGTTIDVVAKRLGRGKANSLKDAVRRARKAGDRRAIAWVNPSLIRHRHNASSLSRERCPAC